MKNKKYLVIGIISVIIVIVLLLINALVINPHQLKVREERIKTSENNLDGFLIAYFSDLHYGKNFNEKDLDVLINKINDIKPDILVFGGDLISNLENGDIDYLKEGLSSLNGKYGKFAVLGDEDFINNEAVNILKDSDFTILDNKNEKIYVNGSFINIVGIDPLVNGAPNIEIAYEGVNHDYYTIVVSHCPDITSNLQFDKTNLILSGHTLGGPVYIPLINYFYRPSGAKVYYKGKYNVKGAMLDITNGVGTKNKDIRLFADAEIVLYKFTK